MEISGTTWVVAADGVKARIFEERRRAAELRELPERAMSLHDDDRPNAHAHRATVHARYGDRRHGAGERDVSAEASRRFLRRVADELEVAAQRGAFDSLVLIAPPRALGVLKSELPVPLQARVAATDPHDAMRDTPDEIRTRVRAARAGSWRR